MTSSSKTSARSPAAQDRARAPFLARLRRGLLVALASTAIRAYIRLVQATTRFELVGLEHYLQLKDRGGGFILAFWHARLLMAPSVRDQTARRVHMLISTHRDGEIIARAVAPFGISFIRGSAANAKKKFKDKSGAPALGKMIAVLQAGDVVGFTPDGPRGPREKAQPGVARLAQLSGAPVLPVAYATSRRRRLHTWDRFYLALPFSRGVFTVGAPIYPPANANAEASETLRQTIEERLHSVTMAADALIEGDGDAPAS